MRALLVVGATLVLAACSQPEQTSQGGENRLGDLRDAVFCKAMADWKLPAFEGLDVQPGELTPEMMQAIEVEMLQSRTAGRITELSDAGDVEALRIEVETRISELRDVADPDARQQGLKDALAGCVERFGV